MLGRSTGFTGTIPGRLPTYSGPGNRTLQHGRTLPHCVHTTPQTTLSTHSSRPASGNFEAGFLWLAWVETTKTSQPFPPSLEQL